MKLSDFKYNLSENLVAQYPAEQRDKSRLMILNREKHSIGIDEFGTIKNFLNEGDCLVINETKVFPARIMGTKEKTEAEVEIFLLRELETSL